MFFVSIYIFLYILSNDSFFSTKSHLNPQLYNHNSLCFCGSPSTIDTIRYNVYMEYISFKRIIKIKTQIQQKHVLPSYWGSHW